jgi:Zn-dependent peptidase ImmA (M78 family)/DNA-binding XRE family transcriptional regulator
VIGRNLKKTRELAEISQERLAELLGVSRATLSAIENGHISIDSSRLLAAARVLGRQVSDFFLDEEEALALLYRAAVDVTAPPAARSAFERFCKAYQELEEIVGVRDSQLPPPDYSASPGAESRPEMFAVQVASSERQRLGLGERDPIVNIFQLLEDQGVRIFRYKLEHDEVFGISAFSFKYGLGILLNAANTIERQIFSSAHEYGHLLMHRRYYQSANPSAGLEKDHPVEIMASCFAANFLVPASGLRDIFIRDVGQKNVGLEDIVFLKRYFKVSARMLLRRLHDVGLIGKQDAQRLATELEQRVSVKEEFVPLDDGLLRDWNLVSRFGHLARKAALDGMVSLSKLAELMGSNVIEARKLVQAWRKELSPLA